MRVLVCGSRTFTDQGVVTRVLDGIDANDSIECVIHGTASGADSCGRLWASVVHTTIEPFPADWKTLGRRAGYVRNEQMLAEGKPDLVVAFVDKPLQHSRGTWNMVILAREAGVKTIVVEVH